MADTHTDGTRMYFRNRPETPLGRIQVAGYVKNTWRTLAWPTRLLGTYGIVYVTEGGGRFHDALGTDLAVKAGDLLVLFPDVPHGYGPKPGGRWSEVYAHFDGPVFDVWRQAGLLDPAKPVHRQGHPDHWRTELDAVLEAAGPDPSAPGGRAGQVVQLSRFVTVLTQMVIGESLSSGDEEQPVWLQTALGLLDTDFGTDYPLWRIAEQTGLPYHTFRKRFEQATGLAPSKYRSARRMEAACSLLLHTKMKIHDIAESLNFNDEFHFSNRFTKYTGLRPSRYRQEGRRGTPPPSVTTAEPDAAGLPTATEARHLPGQ